MGIDRRQLGVRDISTLVMILTLIGMLVGPLRKIFQIEDVIARVQRLDEVTATHTQNIAVINSQYADIQRELQEIKWSVNRIRKKGENE